MKKRKEMFVLLIIFTEMLLKDLFEIAHNCNRNIKILSPLINEVKFHLKEHCS